MILVEELQQLRCSTGSDARVDSPYQYLLAFRHARAPFLAVVPRREVHAHQLTETFETCVAQVNDNLVQ